MTRGRPTRDGWWTIAAAAALGLAALQTGNNLVYLLCSTLLALFLVSLLLSEVSLRGLHLTVTVPEEAYAGRPALVGATLTNRKRWLPSYGIGVHVADPGAAPQVLHLARIEAGSERMLTWEVTMPRRGRHRLADLRIETRFPFGFFVKGARVPVQGEVLVFPAVRPIVPGRALREAGAGSTAIRRRGRGADLYNLRPYRAEDDPRLIHWRSSAKTQALTVREMEEDTAPDVRIVLTGTGRGDADRLERGLSEAASLAVGLLRRGAGVELAGPGLAVPLGRGSGHERRALTALALYAPADPGDSGPGWRAPGGPRRELHVDVG